MRTARRGSAREGREERPTPSAVTNARARKTGASSTPSPAGALVDAIMAKQDEQDDARGRPAGRHAESGRITRGK